MEKRIISTGYIPRPHQEWLHQHLRRFNVLPCHRRFGKTVFALNEKVDRGLRNQLKNPQYHYVAPTFGAAKRISWDYLKDATANFPEVDKNEADLKVDIHRTIKDGMQFRKDRIRIQLLGAENPGNIKGIYSDGVTFDEFAESDPTVWTEVFRPALADRKGWASFIFTPKGANHAHELYRMARKDVQMNGDKSEWFVALFKASETGIIPQSELDAAKAFMSPELYEQEFECSFTAALVGAYYKDEMRFLQENKRLIRVPYDPHAQVFTGWDLGMDDSTVIWFIQPVGQELHAIDYLEVSGKGLSWIVQEVQKKGYAYGRHFLPHDAQARELGTGVTRIETLRKLGLQNVEVVKKLGIEDGINAVRGLLPKMWVDQELCAYGIEALKSYERVFDAKENVFKMKPRHNWASHGADAIRTFAVGWRGDRETTRKDFEDRAQSGYDIMGW